MPRRPGEKWQHEPTSAASHPDRVPSKSLPPLSSMDRMANGEHLGQCPTCGGHQWWDNRARKPMGELSRSSPTTCVRSAGTVDGLMGANGPAGRRRPDIDTIGQSDCRGAGRRAGAWRPSGRDLCSVEARRLPCRNVAMAGRRICGPHSHSGALERVPNRCQGTTKAGPPCRAGAVRGTHYCPQHEPLP